MDYFSNLTYTLFGHHCDQDAYNDGYFNYYGIQYIESGKIALTIDNGEEQLREGPIAFLTTPLYRYRYYTPDGKTRVHYYVCFYGPRVEAWIQGGLFHIDKDNPFIPVPYPELLAERFSVLLNMVQQMHFNRAVACTEMLLLDLLNNENTPKIKSRYSNALDELLDNMSHSPEKNWNFDIEASRLAISRNYLNRLIRDKYHISLGSYLLKCRLELAAQKLAFSPDNISEVARSVGIENPFYFSRLFVQYFAMPPSKYRKNFRSNPKSVKQEFQR